MKAKSLAAKNPYLKQVSSGTLVARNLASSTAVETGKSSDIYVKRYASAKCSNQALKPAAKKALKPAKKSIGPLSPTWPA